MQVTKEDFEQALGEIAPPSFVALAASLLASAADLLTIDEVGSLIAAVLTPEGMVARERIGDLALVGADVTVKGSAAWLSSDQVAMSPLVGDWYSPTLGGAFGAPIESSMTFANHAAGAPVFEACGIIQSPAGLIGQSFLTFESGAMAVLHYGGRYQPGAFVSTVHKIGGDHLFAIGARLREGAAEADRMRLTSALSQMLEPSRVMH